MALADKAAVARILREIALYLQLGGEDPFRSRAYELAGERIAALTEDLEQLVAQQRLQQLPNIGPALAQRITELVTTGRMEYYERLSAAYPAGLLEVMRIPAVGPKRAQALFHQLGVTDPSSLEAACRAGRVRALKGFGPRSEEKILAGVEQLRRIESSGRRPLGELLPLAEALLAEVRASPQVKRVSLAGSLRRFCETVSNVNLLASAADPRPLFQALRKGGEVLEGGGSEWSARLARGDLQIELRVVPDEDFAAALHYLTGSKAHRQRLVDLAREKGFSLSERGIFRQEEKLPVMEDADLYRLLGLPYIPPELREDWGEVEAGLTGKLPGDLVALSDIQGNVHAHSTWSDGKASLEELALAARELGLEYLTVTEHSPTAFYAGGLKEEDLKRQWDEIDALNEKLTGIRLLKGAESDILEDGSLDYPERVLERLEVVIGSIHQRHGQDEEQATRRVLAAFDNPYLKIWGHPTGRLIHQRDPIPLRMEEILDKAAKVGLAVEVNGSPERLDLKAEHVRMAVERGVKLVASTDAHRLHELSNLRFAVATARKGWARKGDVLNTLPAQEFVRALRRHSYHAR